MIEFNLLPALLHVVGCLATVLFYVIPILILMVLLDFGVILVKDIYRRFRK